MKTSRVSRRILAVIAVSTAITSLSACAGEAPTSEPDAGEEQERISVGLFVANAFGDHSYYDAALETVDALESDFDATVTTYEGKLETQNYGPLLQDAADANELVYVVGNQAIDATVEAATQNPDTTFVFVNGVVPSDEVVSVAYRYAESCFAGGAIAALISADAGKDAVGFMGGFEAPSIADCEAGYTQGAHAENPDLTIVSRYVGSFSDPAKGLETATAIAQQGAYVIYSTAGLSGQGAVKAAEGGAELAPIMAAYPNVPEVSPAVVNDDTGVLILSAAESYVDGSLAKGDIRTFGFKEDAFSVQYNDAFLDADQQKTIDSLIAQIVAGDIVPEGAPRG